METKQDSSKLAVDQLYERKLDYEEIKQNPILQPVAEANSTYKSHGLNVQMAMSEFIRLKEEIEKMIELNDDYSQTIIVAKMQAIIMYARQVIHSQDLQREETKKVVNDMIRINEKYFVLKEKENYSEKQFPILDEIIQKKEEKEEDKEEKEFDELFNAENKAEEPTSKPEPELPKKRGRPKKLPIEEIENEIENEEEAEEDRK